MKKKNKVVAYVVATTCCLFLQVSCQSANLPVGVTAKVERVVSGNTIEVTLEKKIIEKVRLLGISAPDLKQEPWGIAAKVKLEELLKNQTVLLESDVESQDNYNRILAYIWQNDILINEKLITEGYVLAEVLPPNIKYQERFLRGQEYARLMGYGIWNPKKPMRLTPKEFRDKKR